MLMLKKNNIALQPAFLIYLAFSLLLLPFRWLLAWLLAVSLHELSHWLMLCAMKVKIYSVTFGANGAEIETEHMMNHRELLCALAGPLGSCILVIFIRIYPELAVCGILQSLYNFLPIYPLDGGRVLRCLSGMLLNDEWSTAVVLSVEWVVFAILFVVAVYCTFILKLGVVPLVLLCALFLKNKSIKIPCKHAKQIVQ